MRGVCAVNQTVAGWGKLLMMDLQKVCASSRLVLAAETGIFVSAESASQTWPRWPLRRWGVKPAR
jgi:hypothetical protein